MPHLIAALAILRAHLTRPDDEPERGSVTIEHVLWAVAAILFVGIVVAAITSYVTDQAGKIT